MKLNSKKKKIKLEKSRSILQGKRRKLLDIRSSTTKFVCRIIRSQYGSKYKTLLRRMQRFRQLAILKNKDRKQMWNTIKTLDANEQEIEEIGRKLIYNDI